MMKSNLMDDLNGWRKRMNRLSTLTFDTQSMDSSASQLRQAFEAKRALFQAQPRPVQSFLESQSLLLARALTQNLGQVRFFLPDQVNCMSSTRGEMQSIPDKQRQQRVKGIASLIRHLSLQAALNDRLATLETSNYQGVVVGAALIRFTTATIMVRSLLPSGRSVSYKVEPGEEVPSQPIVNEKGTDAGVRSTRGGDESHHERDLDDGFAPYVPEARRFFLPQWVAFDEHGQLLVNTINEARTHIASMQAFMRILRIAAELAPYIVAEPEYQRKRYGMMGQLVNQGRRLARHETDEIIRCIRERVRQNRLNRGLSLSLPYFDDQDMEMKNLDFVAIPGGRIMFVPAFLVLAVCEAQAKVTQDDQMSPSTRQHLLAELKALEKAFDTGNSR
jgi:hypothetical protein